MNDYDLCLNELNEYIENNKDYFVHNRIKNNFLVVSNYNNNINWVPEYTDNYLIYDKSEKSEYPKTIDLKKVTKSKNIGYNIYDYCTFIIDNYDNLPDRVMFVKGNIFPRHITKEYFERIMNNGFFTPIEDYKMHKTYWPTCFFSSDGGFCELNNSWYLNHHATKYFHNYNDFIRYCFKDPIIPRYIRFAPGANYIVPKEHILKLPKVFYENLKIFVSHSQLAGEAHIIERALHTLWICNFEINENMLMPVNDNFVAIPVSNSVSNRKNISMSVQVICMKLRDKINIYLKNTNLFKRKFSTEEIAKYRKTIKIYDIFTFFNELDLLEIRFNILDEYVDYFVIVEGIESVAGFPKPLYYMSFG